ncbi:MAG: metal ABC transporter ATP-binding protein [Sporichthyaceae bacterium]
MSAPSTQAGVLRPPAAAGSLEAAGAARQVVVRAREVCVTYGRVCAVERVSLDLTEGQLVALIGRNGAGKSSLLRALAGLSAHSTGEVSWHRPASCGARSQLRVAYIPQRASPRWDLPISVDQAVAAARIRPGRWWARPGEHDERAVSAALAALDLLDLRQRAVGTLSGGQAQRLLLARALAQDPHVLLLDEPFEGLDAATVTILLGALRLAGQRGVAVCAAMHQLHLARDHFDRVIAVDRTLLVDGPPATVLCAQGVLNLVGLGERP